MNRTLKKLVAMLLCALMLMSSMTFVSAAEEKSVKAKMTWADSFDDTYNEITSPVFSETDLEPGESVIKYLKLENTGNRAFSYALNFTSAGEIGELAEVIDVYAKSVTAGYTIAEDDKLGTLEQVINGDEISTGKILPEGLTGGDFSAGVTYVAVALKMQDDASDDYQGESVGAFDIVLTATEDKDFGDYPNKFAVKFENTDKYLYRVGNQNEVALGSLFEELDGVTVGSVSVTVEKIDSATDVSGTYTPNADWTKGTIQFTGTGPVKVTIDDDTNTNAVSLKLEVIDAKNLTSAASVTSGDAVLLNDVTFSTISVANGYTLYGNGFTMTSPDDISDSDWGNTFVLMENGTLDNVRVICPNFSYQVLFQSNMKDAENPKETDAFFYNVRSAVKMSGNSKIVNSYVSGGRVAVHAVSGTPVIDNSTIYGGAAANIHVVTVKNLLLKDTTLIQEPIQATVHDTSKTIMGMSVYLEADAYGISSPITLEGDFVQYAWANEEYEKYVPSAAKSFVSSVLAMNEFKHNVTYKDGITRESLNLGIACIPGDLVKADRPSVTDNRTNKDFVPYVSGNVSLASVYSYVNTNGLDESFAIFPEYETECSMNIPATVAFNDSAEGLRFINSYIADEGWQATLTVDLDNVVGGSYTFEFDKLVAEKYGRGLSYIVKDSSGNIVDKNAAIVLNDSGVYDYVLEVTDNVYYGTDGQLVSNRTEAYSYKFSLIATKTSILPPEQLECEWEDPLLVVKSKNNDWSCAAPASLSGINIRYYSTADKAYKDLNLGGIIPTTTGKANRTENFWEYKGPDYTFKITCSKIHDTKNVYGMPVVVNNGGNKMYFTISSTNGYVSTNTVSRAVTLTYEFTDGNGNTITFSKSWTVNRQDTINAGGIQYSYSDFVNGKLTDTASSGGSDDGCFAEGTMITLADGSQKAIEDLTFEDELLVWDLFKGEYTTSVPSLLIDDGEDDYEIITVKFDDETEVRVIYEHGFYDVEANDYVYINKDNVADFVGHKFVKNNGTENTVVEMTSYEITKERIGCHTILTAQHNNCIANGMLTVTPPPVDGWYDYFEIGDGMKYDTALMEQDIENYGLYTYDDFSDYISYEEYVAFNGAYLKVLVGKGYFTFDDILEQIAVFGVGSDYISENTDIVPLSDEEAEPFVATVTSSNNNITAAVYSVEISCEGATEKEGVYTCISNTAVFTITPNGTATKGYVTITVDGDTYTVPVNGSYELTVKNAKDKMVTFKSSWESADNTVTDNTIDLGCVTIKSVNKTETGAVVTLSNTTKYDEHADIYFAVYDSQSRLVAVKGAANSKIDAKNDAKEITFEAEIPADGTVKAFAWTVDSTVPLTAVIGD